MITSKDYYLQEGSVLTRLLYIPLDCDINKLIPEGITELGPSCFTNLDLPEELSIPSTVTKIHPNAFANTTGLKILHIPDSVKMIGGGAFTHCKDLEELYYPAKIQWGPSCFYECSKLKYLHKNNDTARIFYLPKSKALALTALDTNLSTNEYKIYSGIFPEGGNLATSIIDYAGKDVIVYFAVVEKDGIEYIWFDVDPNTALIGAKYKASNLGYYSFFHKSWSLDKDEYITKQELKMLLGICYDGAEFFFRLCGYHKENDKAQLSKLIDMAKTKFPRAYIRVMYALDHQYEPNHFLDFENIMAWEDVGVDINKLLGVHQNLHNNEIQGNTKLEK